MIKFYAIDQRFLLDTGEIQNYLVLRFPNGKETRAPIDLDTTKEILKGTGDKVEAKAPESDPEPHTNVGSYEEMVHWAGLGDDVLHPLMKEALRRMGVSDAVSMGTLESIVSQINERFTQEDWQELVGEPAAPQAAPAPPAPAPQPQLGSIQWADGRPIVPAATRPGRTVQKDEMGYPMAQAGEVDPGELVGGTDSDEDGVGQL